MTLFAQQTHARDVRRRTRVMGDVIRMNIDGHEFTLVCAIEPRRGPDGSIHELLVWPGSRGRWLSQTSSRTLGSSSLSPLVRQILGLSWLRPPITGQASLLRKSRAIFRGRSTQSLGGLAECSDNLSSARRRCDGGQSLWQLPVQGCTVLR